MISHIFLRGEQRNKKRCKRKGAKERVQEKRHKRKGAREKAQKKGCKRKGAKERVQEKRRKRKGAREKGVPIFFITCYTKMLLMILMIHFNPCWNF